MVTLKGREQDVVAASLRHSIGELEMILQMIEKDDTIIEQNLDPRLKRVETIIHLLRRRLQERRATW
ncbi:MAG: hypothetical protein PHV55_08430 [Candidatus Omnitrophica bacterium]|nr:hypothetical protein [Candidatus Omnitrophota bacterium]